MSDAAGHTLSRVRAVSAEIGKRAGESDRLVRLPADTVGTMTEAGCFRMLAPARHGGDELPLPVVLPAISELARADAAAGWIAGQVALAQLIIGCCPPEAVAEVFAAGPDVLAAGAVAPKGRAAAAPGSWRVTGRWPYVSGCVHASWFYFNCAVQDGRQLVRNPDGTPMCRMVVVPASDVEVEPTWRSLGLRGTGSHDVRVGAVMCPDHRSFTLTPDRAGALVAARIAVSSLIVAAVAVGIAGAALGEVMQLACGGKRPALSLERLSRSTQFQDQLGAAHARAMAASALLSQQAAAADLTDVPTAQQRAELRAAAATVISDAGTVVDTAYTLAGGTAVYDSSPLQRQLRDMRSVTQHFIAGRQSYAALGALLVGESPETGAY